MIKNVLLSFSIFLVLCFASIVYAQDQNNTANQQAQTATTADADNGASAEKMLKEIQQLQEKQSKEEEAKFGSVTPRTQATNQNTSEAQKARRFLRKPEYHSDFEYPHKKAQVQLSPIMQELNRGAFANAAQQALPLNPQQIHRLKQLYDSAQFAAAAPAGTPPKPVATSIFVNLSPGSSPPAIRLSEGFVSSLVFLDSTGAPWPIEAYDLGNPNAFNIAWDKKDNVLMVQAKTLYTYGNLAVRLRGLNTPIMLTLIPGQAVVDYRTDVTVPGYGPDAKQLPINTGLPPQATPILLNVLDGVPPNGSKQLKVNEAIGDAWLLKGKLYLRTHFTLLSPGWLATMSSADGTNAYELQPTPMLLVSRNGKIEHVKVGGL